MKSKIQMEDEYRDALIASIPLDRLEAICAAEKEGRCVVLPQMIDGILHRARLGLLHIESVSAMDSELYREMRAEE